LQREEARRRKASLADRVSGTVASLDIGDADGDGQRDIALTTTGGAKVFLDSSGHPSILIRTRGSIGCGPDLGVSEGSIRSAARRLC